MAQSLGPHVAVIGGGVAGLAAATKLAQANSQVTLFEASAQLGGRARGVSYKGLKLDNGQHILLGAYAETLRLLKLAGVDESQGFMRLPLQLLMLDLAGKNNFSLKTCSALPAPFHILTGLLFAKGVTLGSRLSAIKLMAWMRLKNFQLLQDEPLAAFLQRKNQPAHLVKNLWEPLCLAALNTSVAIASTQVFLNVIADSFAKQKTNSDLLLPRVDLTSLLADPLANYIRQRGGAIKINCTVKDIQQIATGFTLTTNNSEYSFSHVIIACAPYQLSKISQHLPQTFKPAEHFNYQAITTVYLQYAETIQLPQAMTGLVGGISQWAFDRGQLCGQHGLIAIVISAHQPLEKMTQNVLAEAVEDELKTFFPYLEKPIWHKVITEKRATFSCDANLVRPTVATGIENLYLAGDYTTGGYPATIEGAVRSGISSAELVIGRISEA